jgi:hypothetical protein
MNAEPITLRAYNNISIVLSRFSHLLIGTPSHQTLHISHHDAHRLVQAIDKLESVNVAEEEKLSNVINLTFPIPYLDGLVPIEDEDIIDYTSRQSHCGYIKACEWRLKVARMTLEQLIVKVSTSSATLYRSQMGYPGGDASPVPRRPGMASFMTQPSGRMPDTYRYPDFDGDGDHPAGMTDNNYGFQPKS